MKLIIDIDEKVKEDFIKRGLLKGVIAQAIENGTPVKKVKLDIHGQIYYIYVEV